MNNFRRMIFFFLAIFVLAGAYEVSADHFAITDASFTPVNLTAGVGFQDRVIAIQFNITNVTGWDDNMTGSGDTYWDNISNITIQAIDVNGNSYVLGSNTTGPGNGGVLIAEEIATVGGGNYVYVVHTLITYNNSLLNETNVPATGSITLNVTFEILNLTGNGEFNESINNAGHSILFDVFGPKVSIKFLDRLNNEKTSFEATDTVKIVCTRSSALSNFNDTNVTIKVPGGNGFDHLESSSTRASAATEFEVTFSETRELGDYTAACFARDDNDLLNDTVNTTFTIVSKPPRSTSAFANPSFQRPAGQKIVSETEDLGKVSEQGTSRLLKKDSVVKVDIKGETHTITVKELSPTSLTLVIESTPQEITFNKGETKEVDVDGDGQNDLAITFHQQYKTGSRATADVTLKAISTPAEPKKDTTQQPTTKTDDETSKGSFAGSAIVTIIVIVAIVVIGFALIRGKKR